MKYTIGIFRNLTCHFLFIKYLPVFHNPLLFFDLLEIIDSHSNLFKCLKELTGQNKSVTGESEFEDYDRDDGVEVHVAPDLDLDAPPGIETPIDDNLRSEKSKDKDVELKENSESESCGTSINRILNEIIKLQKQQKDMAKNLDRFSSRVEDEFKTIRHRINECQTSIENFLGSIDSTKPTDSINSIKKSILTKCPLVETEEEFQALNKLLEVEDKKTQLLHDMVFIGGDDAQKFISQLMHSLFSNKMMNNMTYTGHSTKSTGSKLKLEKTPVYNFIRGKCFEIDL